MAPVVGIGSLATIGYRVQSAFGTPNPPAATAGQWAYLVANSLDYDKGLKERQVAAGTLDPNQFVEADNSKTTGSFEVALTGRTGMNLVADFLGVASDAINTTSVFTGLTNHVMTPKASLRYITFEDQWDANPATPDGEGYQLEDCVLDSCDLSYASGKGWSWKYTVLGGKGSTAVTPPTVPTYASPPDAHWLQWGHTSAVTMPGSIPIKHVLNLSLMMKRNVQQVFGGGNFHATDAASGMFNVTGSIDVVFGSAAAATAYATDYVGETEVPIGWTIGVGDVTAATTARQVVVAATRCRLMKATKKWAIGSLTACTFPFTVLDSTNNLTITTVTPDAGAY